MAAPKGNKNAIGNKGGGRKSAYEEMAVAEVLNDIFFREFNLDQLKARIDSGSYSVIDLFILKGLKGDVRIMTSVFNRIFPDKINLHTNSVYGRKSTEKLQDEELDRIMKIFNTSER